MVHEGREAGWPELKPQTCDELLRTRSHHHLSVARLSVFKQRHRVTNFTGGQPELQKYGVS